MTDETRFSVIERLGSLTSRLAQGTIAPQDALAVLREAAKLLGPQALLKGAARPMACPADGLADEVRAAGFRLSDTQVEEMVRDGTTPTISGSAEVRRLLASFRRRQLPDWAAKREDGREAYLRKLVREHALDPVPPTAPRAVGREPEQQSLTGRPVSIHEFLADNPDLAGKAAPLLAGFGGIVQPEKKKIAFEPAPLEGEALEAAKRRAKGGG